MNDIELAEHAWLGLDDLNEVRRNLVNPLTSRSEWDIENPGIHEVRLMKDPQYIAFAAQTLLKVNLLPIQAAILRELWIRPFPMYIASRGFGKSYLLAVLAMLKCALVPGTKIVIVGAAFRQSKVIFEYMETIWHQADVLRSLCDNRSGPKGAVDRCTMNINSSWAIAIPLGNGEKIRGLRAHTVMADEFNSISPDIYETVVQGFASVSSDPLQNVIDRARRDYLKKRGLWTEMEERTFDSKIGNQIIISGTAGYDFQHFADYWRRYKGIINSKGDPNKLREFVDMDDMEDFHWDNYSIIRVPYKLIPKGFMDDKVIARARATVHSGIYQMEYECVFSSDSDGFFKRSLIESCVTSKSKPVNLPSGSIWFDATTRGNTSKKYVYGIDPASEVDNFSIVILELQPDHTRIVYAWTTNRQDFKKRLKAGLTKEHDFYGFCARKIRELMKTFPCERIGMDAQGGGIAIMEALHDPSKIYEKELPIWPVIDPDKEADTDIEPGLHILEMCQFAKADWTSEANHGLRKDFEDKVLLFPRFDSVTLELANADDAVRVDKYESQNPGKTLSIYDSLEDSVMEIEQLKDELTTIIITRTGTGVQSRDRWDTPEIKKEGGKKGRMRKDRYSSLVMANMLARQIHRTPSQVEYDVIGGSSASIMPGKGGNNERMYYGPEWFTKGSDQFIGQAINRGGV